MNESSWTYDTKVAVSRYRPGTTLSHISLVSSTQSSLDSRNRSIIILSTISDVRMTTWKNQLLRPERIVISKLTKYKDRYKRMFGSDRFIYGSPFGSFSTNGLMSCQYARMLAYQVGSYRYSELTSSLELPRSFLRTMVLWIRGQGIGLSNY